MKKIFYIYFALTLASASTLFAAKNTTVKEMPPVTAAVPAAAPVESQRTPLPDATAWSFHTGSYAGNGILGGSLQFGLASWFRLVGGITGSLTGDQPSGAFSVDNYAFLWQFSGGLMFISSKIYYSIFRPYSMFELTYYHDARAKAGGLNGSFRVGIDFYMTDDYSVFVETGVIAPFMRELRAPIAVGSTAAVGVRFYF